MYQLLKTERKIMTTFHLIFREFIHRKLNFLLSLLALLTAVTLFVSFFTTGQAAKRETTRLMRDMGFNLRIIPKNTDMNKFWTMGFSESTMPEDYVHRFASNKELSYNHLVATLQQRIFWRGQEVILTGISPEEVAPPGKKKKPMIFTIKPGTVHVGFELAHSLGIETGDEIDILGRSFTVAQLLAEMGSDDDIRIYGHLLDVQRLLGMEGRINEIKALECVCFTMSSEEFRATLREQLAQVLPEAKVIEIQAIAIARQRQRLMVEKYFALIMPFVLSVCAVWIGALALMNVRERRYEIGIMRALGYSSSKIASLFLLKAVIIGLIGAAVGFGIGTGLAWSYGSEIFKITANMIKPVYALLGWSVIAAPMFAALSSFIPAMVAITQDPALTLREG
jgi:putative ABC transport system permease protein